MNNAFIDLTFPVTQKLPKWPGSIGITVSTHMKMPADTNNLSSISIDCHLGTHLDAPLHFIHNGKSIEQLDLNKCIGEAFVCEMFGKRAITYADLEAAKIPLNCKRLLLKTDNQQYWDNNLITFQEDFCSIDLSGAKWLLDRGVELIGIDYLSIQRFYDGPEVHQLLLNAEVVIVETLNLANVTTGWYDLICLPIKLEGLEGAPVRAIAKPINYE